MPKTRPDSTDPILDSPQPAPGPEPDAIPPPSEAAQEPPKPPEPPPEPIPVERRVQTGVPLPGEGEDVHQLGTEAAPAPSLEQRDFTKPVEPQFAVPAEPPPGFQVSAPTSG